MRRDFSTPMMNGGDLDYRSLRCIRDRHLSLSAGGAFDIVDDLLAKAFAGSSAVQCAKVRFGEAALQRWVELPRSG
jgi:hypothetical protein